VLNQTCGLEKGSLGKSMFGLGVMAWISSLPKRQSRVCAVLFSCGLLEIVLRSYLFTLVVVSNTRLKVSTMHCLLFYCR
jgi:hypothetical protein